MSPSTIASINLLPEIEKRSIYTRYIPPPLLSRFHLPHAESPEIQDFLTFNFPPGSSSVELSLFHERDFVDPVLYTHLTDTINGQLHILLYILNDPGSPRFDVDRLPDGTLTKFGTAYRNLPAERGALEAGLAPGQIRRGLGLLGEAIAKFEEFVASLGQELYFVEPLYYHNAVIFEHHGFAYQVGRRLMEEIHEGFAQGGRLAGKLDASSPFRSPHAAGSVRLRSWAIHDGILGSAFTNVTMYKRVRKRSDTSTSPGINW